MPVVRPFRGIHYDFARFNDLSGLLAPPFDALDPPSVRTLLDRDPHNAVRLEVEPPAAGDGGAETPLSRIARRLEEWRATRVLVRDERPAFYVLEQRFEEGGEERVRLGFLGSLELVAWGDGVFPFETRVDDPVAERLERYRTVRAQTAPVVVLYPDDRGEARAALEAVRGGAPSASGLIDGVEHRLWVVEDPSLATVIAGRKLFVAEGQQRYEAARRLAGDEERPDAGILAFFCALRDPGLVVRPIHRMVVGASFHLERLLLLLDEHFDVELLAEDVRKPAGRAWALRRLAEAGRTGHAVLLLSRSDRRARLLRLKQGVDLAQVAALPRNPTLRTLDVTLVQSLVLQHTMAMAPEGQGWGEHLVYVEEPAALVERVLGEIDEPGELGFVLNPTPLWQLRAVAEAGERMPPRTVRIHPRVPGGLVLDTIDRRNPA